MAQITVKHLNRSNDWYPTFNVTIHMSMEEHKAIAARAPFSKYATDVKILKGGVVKYSKSSMHMGDNASVENAFICEAKIMNMFGVAVDGFDNAVYSDEQYAALQSNKTRRPITSLA